MKDRLGHGPTGVQPALEDPLLLLSRPTASADVVPGQVDDGPGLIGMSRDPDDRIVLARQLPAQGAADETRGADNNDFFRPVSRSPIPASLSWNSDGLL